MSDKRVLTLDFTGSKIDVDHGETSDSNKGSEVIEMPAEQSSLEAKRAALRGAVVQGKRECEEFKRISNTFLAELRNLALFSYIAEDLSEKLSNVHTITHDLLIGEKPKGVDIKAFKEAQVMVLNKLYNKYNE